MVLEQGDLVFYYTNDAEQATNTLSLGGTISLNTITSDVANNVFDDVTGDESWEGDTEYRAIAIKNESTTNDYLNVYVYIKGFVRAGTDADTISFVLEKPSGSPESIQLLQDEDDTAGLFDPDRCTVATGETVTWTTEGAPSNSLFYGTLSTLDWFGIWFRREVPERASPFDERKCTLELKGETTASPPKEFKITLVVNWNDFSIERVDQSNVEMVIKHI